MKTQTRVIEIDVDDTPAHSPWQNTSHVSSIDMITSSPSPTIPPSLTEQPTKQSGKNRANKIAKKKSCHHCRKSHIKCDGLRPCSNCLTRKRSCIEYDINLVQKQAMMNGDKCWTSSQQQELEEMREELKKAKNTISYLQHQNQHMATSQQREPNVTLAPTNEFAIDLWNPPSDLKKPHLVWNPSTMQVIGCNAAYRNATGFSKEILQQLNLFSLMPERFRASSREIMQWILRSPIKVVEGVSVLTWGRGTVFAKCANHFEKSFVWTNVEIVNQWDDSWTVDNIRVPLTVQVPYNETTCKTVMTPNHVLDGIIKALSSIIAREKYHPEETSYGQQHQQQSSFLFYSQPETTPHHSTVHFDDITNRSSSSIEEEQVNTVSQNPTFSINRDSSPMLQFTTNNTIVQQTQQQQQMQSLQQTQLQSQSPASYEQPLEVMRQWLDEIEDQYDPSENAVLPSEVTSHLTNQMLFQKVAMPESMACTTSNVLLQNNNFQTALSMPPQPQPQQQLQQQHHPIIINPPAEIYPTYHQTGRTTTMSHQPQTMMPQPTISQIRQSSPPHTTTTTTVANTSTGTTPSNSTPATTTWQFHQHQPTAHHHHHHHHSNYPTTITATSTTTTNNNNTNTRSRSNNNNNQSNQVIQFSSYYGNNNPIT